MSLTEDDVRRIVTEVLDERAAARSEELEIRTAMLRTSTEFHLENLLEGLHAPDDVKEQMRTYLKAIIGEMPT